MKKHKLKQSFFESCSVFFRVLLLFLPMTLYIIFTLFLYPVPNSGFLVLGAAGTFFLGFGLALLSSFGVKKLTCGSVVSIAVSVAGIVCVVISLFVLYNPFIYSLFDEVYVTFYFFAWLILVVAGIWYAFFRHSIVESLRDKGISRTSIKKHWKGAKNYWFYDALHAQFNLGLSYYLNCIFVIIYPITIGLHLFLGWHQMIGHLIAVLLAVICIMSSILWVYAFKKNPEALLVGIAFPLFLCYSVVSYALEMWKLM